MGKLKIYLISEEAIFLTRIKTTIKKMFGPNVLILEFEDLHSAIGELDYYPDIIIMRSSIGNVALPTEDFIEYVIDISPSTNIIMFIPDDSNMANRLNNLGVAELIVNDNKTLINLETIIKNRLVKILPKVKVFEKIKKYFGISKLMSYIWG